MSQFVRIRQSALLSLCLFASAVHGFSDQGWDGQILSLNWDNDAFAGTDRHYTQGLEIRYWSRDNALPRWMQWVSDGLPALGMNRGAAKWGLGVGQEIYTPEDLQNPDLIVSDRPYAGWLYASLGLQRRGQTRQAWLVRETLRLDLGVIGPEALGEAAQNLFHDNTPRGWVRQLPTEPGFVFRYDRAYLFGWRDAAGRWSLQAIPQVKASLGNVDISLHLGGQVRFGYHVPNEFETPAQPSRPAYGFYFVGGATGRFVGHNLFLDGSTFTASHRVTKHFVVGEFRAGLVVVLKRVELGYTHVFLTEEFRLQKPMDSYGAVTLTTKF